MRRSLKYKSKTVIIRVIPDEPGYEEAIRMSAGILRNGGLVAFPTETVYGIAANILSSRAIKRLYQVKKRPRSKPLTVHIADFKDVKKMGCALKGPAKKMADKFWPGPLTIILKSGTGKKIGFRMPANRVALDLIKKAGVPIVAPSANISGNRPPKSAGMAAKELDGCVDIVLDGGRARIGIESTVVDMSVSPPRILRKGAISGKAIAGMPG